VTEILNIQQLARAVGLAADTLRRYEARGLIPPARRDRNGYRFYTPEDLKKVLAAVGRDEPDSAA